MLTHVLHLRPLALLSLLVMATIGCQTTIEVPTMGSAQIVSDFESYTIRRVGFLPFRPLHSAQLGAADVASIETSFHAEFSSGTSYDIVALSADDLSEILPLEPFRRGTYAPEAILAIRDRYRLDALLVGSVTARQVTPPLVFGAQIDLISCETGQTLWSADLLLDSSIAETREALGVWAEEKLGEEHAARMAMISPRKFAHFAAYQMARLL